MHLILKIERYMNQLTRFIWFLKTINWGKVWIDFNCAFHVLRYCQEYWDGSIMKTLLLRLKLQIWFLKIEYRERIKWRNKNLKWFSVFYLSYFIIHECKCMLTSCQDGGGMVSNMNCYAFKGWDGVRMTLDVNCYAHVWQAEIAIVQVGYNMRDFYFLFFGRFELVNNCGYFNQLKYTEK